MPAKSKDILNIALESLIKKYVTSNLVDSVDKNYIYCLNQFISNNIQID